MDSMRSLNTSLPSSSSSRQPPPEQLLQAFRTAALSVTNLYKAAATDQINSRQAGYQEALEDLLGFLDRENLGLQDGEGWRVRQWATERYDGSSHQHAESDEERSDADARPRSLSPIRSRSPELTRTHSEPPRVDATTIPVDDTQSSVNTDTTTSQPMFRFTGNTAADDMQTDETHPISADAQASSPSTVTPIRLEVVNNNRGNRTPHRHSTQRHTPKTNNRDFTFTAGTKRKLQFPDFFDISNIGFRDASGGSKRGRLS